MCTGEYTIIMAVASLVIRTLLIPMHRVGRNDGPGVLKSCLALCVVHDPDNGTLLDMLKTDGYTYDASYELKEQWLDILLKGCNLLKIHWFAELCSILDPKKPPAKVDKVVILTDANRLLNQVCLEAQKLKESNEVLQVSLKNLKAEKVELMDKKVRLKAEKERMEKLLRFISISR